MARSNESCITCPAGKLSDSLNAVACDACPVGGFCGAVAAASVRQTFEACPAGTFNPDRGQSSNASCRACAPGKANPIPGSSASVCLDRHKQPPAAGSATASSAPRACS